MVFLTKTQLVIPGMTAWGQAGELDKQVAEEATEKALKSLLAH